MKKSLKVFSLFLIFCMLLAALPMAGQQIIPSVSAAQTESYQVGDIITFGSYPQSRVTDENLLEQLDAAEKNWQSYGYYSGTGNKDGQMQSGDWMRYADIILSNGTKIRAVTFDTYRPSLTINPSTTSEKISHQKENGYTCGNIYYFQYEPLQWRVLNPKNGLVLCKDIIDAQAFHNTIIQDGPIYWQDETKNVRTSDYVKSSIRQWLINDFYNTAFTASEQALIQETPLDNMYCSAYAQNDSIDMTDSIYLLSWNDSNFADEQYVPSEYCAYGTDYAKCQGVNGSGYPKNGAADWWLQSHVSDYDFAAVVYSNSICSSTSYTYATDTGVRPAFRFRTGGIDSQNDGETDYKVGDIITFGGYPQSLVTDEETLAALDAAEKNWKSYGYYSGTGDPQNWQMQPGDWMRYTDIMLDGVKYRAVTFDDYRPYSTGNNLSAIRSWQDENGYTPGNTYYFRYESLNWRVLDPENGLVLCESIIDAQAFQNTIYEENSNTWQDSTKSAYASDYARSSLRQWLIEDFYNTAFSASEQAEMKETVLDNSSCNVEWYDSEPTTDKIFLLSYNDVSSVYFSFDHEADSERNAFATDYAKCQGVGATSGNDGSSRWWLRSPSMSYSAAIVNYGGDCFGIACQCPSTSVGIRPAFQFRSEIIETDNPNGAECTPDNHFGLQTVETVLTPATCGDAGEKKIIVKCTVCGETISETTEPIQPTGAHTPGEPTETVVKTPTCTEEGVKKTTVACTACGAILSETESVMEKTQHIDADHNGVCDVCSQTVDTDPASHSGNCVCGKTHTGPFAWLVIFFHRITFVLKNLFSK